MTVKIIYTCDIFQKVEEVIPNDLDHCSHTIKQRKFKMIVHNGEVPIETYQYLCEQCDAEFSDKLICRWKEFLKETVEAAQQFRQELHDQTIAKETVAALNKKSPKNI